MNEQWPAWIGIAFVLLGHLIAIVAIGVKLSAKVDALREAQVATTKAIESGALVATGILGTIAKQDSRLAVLEQRMATTESDIREVRLTARDAASGRHGDPDKQQQVRKDA